MINRLLYNKNNFPNKIAIRNISENKSKEIILNWNDLYNNVISYTKIINSYKIPKNNNIALYCSNNTEFVVSFYAVFVSQHPLFVINKKSPDDQICNLLKFTNTKIIFYDEMSNKLKNLIKKTNPKIKLQSLKDKKFLIDNQNKKIINKKDELLIKNFKPKLNKTALLLCTSGTTAKPKIVKHSFNSINEIAKSTTKTVLKDNTSFLTIFPYYHIGGLYNVWTSLFTTDELIILEGKVTAQRIINTVKKHSVTYLVVPAPLINDMILYYKKNKNAKNFNPGTSFFTGAQNVSENFIHQWFKYFPDCRHRMVYGSTEGGFIMFANIFHETDLVPYANKYTSKLKITKNNELTIKGPAVFSGYYKNPYATKKVLKNGWLHTGDIVKMNKDKSISITGRIDDIINSGGEGINPTEVEKYLLENFDIEDVIVLPIPDKKFGEQVGALIDPGKSKITESQILNNCNDLPVHMRPKCVKFAKNYKAKGYKINKREIYNRYFQD